MSRISVVLPLLVLSVRMMNSEQIWACMNFKECSEHTKVSNDFIHHSIKEKDVDLLKLSCGDKMRDTGLCAANCGIVSFVQSDFKVKRGYPTSRDNHSKRHVVWIIRHCKWFANSLK